MGRGRSLYDYRFFARRYAQLRKTFFLSQSLLSSDSSITEVSRYRLVLLNDRRRTVQHNLGLLSSYLSNVCHMCKGSCCLDSYDHFMATDYWLRRYSDSRLDSFGTENKRIMSNCQIFFDRIHRLAYNYDYSHKNGGNGCQFLGVEGCILDDSERPIKCSAFTCRKLRKSMTVEQKKHYAVSIRDLYSISHEVLDILKKEAKVHSQYGEFSLLTTL